MRMSCHAALLPAAIAIVDPVRQCRRAKGGRTPADVRGRGRDALALAFADPSPARRYRPLPRTPGPGEAPRRPLTGPGGAAAPSTERLARHLPDVNNRQWNFNTLCDRGDMMSIHRLNGII